ncbi:RNA-processing protein [Candidatus Woesearchaeota archaeon]|nr:RNA-processing protein [Candidatus Woesearchaeota archaeon]
MSKTKTKERILSQEKADNPSDEDLNQDLNEDSDSNSQDFNNLDEFSYELKIPEERVAVLIGTEGKTKKEIEENSGCKLDISKEGDVQITSNDGLKLYTAKEIVRAVGRGFNPKTALLLLKPDYALEIMDLSEMAGKNKNILQRIKGRVIGTGGKSREEIERLTETEISVYGKTASIIGETANASMARRALGMLLEGAMHRTVYRFLEKQRKEMIFGEGAKF